MAPRHHTARLLRTSASLAVLALFAACSTPRAPNTSSTDETARYVAQARRSYAAPGTAADPWGPYIHEASARFDIPDHWVRALMRVESGGTEYRNGRLITSSAGAMGLMQVMPGTYDELRFRYNLGDDPFDPHDNILAGVAYMREMYDIYGAPGFLAAYNAGPARLDDYLANNRPLPDETRRYVAMIGPNLLGVYPHNRSPAEQYAMNALPLNIPPGNRYGRAMQLAGNGGGGRVPLRAPVEVAQLPPPPRGGWQPTQQYAALVAPPSPPPTRHGFQLIASANAAEAAPLHRGPAAAGQWAIQVGAFSNPNQAQTALGAARAQARAELAVAHPTLASVHQPHGQLWRARLTGLSRETAIQACERLAHGRQSCVVLSPESQI
jgi:cell division septation protein DedD